MQALQSDDLLSSDTTAMAQLQEFLRQRRETHAPVVDLDACAQVRIPVIPATQSGATLVLGHFM